MTARTRLLLLALAAASLFVAASAVSVEPRTPAPGAQAPLPKMATPTPLPVRNDVPLKLPACTATGMLKWDAQLLKDSNASAPGYVVYKSAYSGSMTITANKTLTGFLPLKVVASAIGFGETGDCGGWVVQQVDLAKGQTKAYPVRCTWGPRDTSGDVVEGVVKVGYAGSTLSWCDGKVAFGK